MPPLVLQVSSETMAVATLYSPSRLALSRFFFIEKKERTKKILLYVSILGEWLSTYYTSNHFFYFPGFLLDDTERISPIFLVLRGI